MLLSVVDPANGCQGEDREVTCYSVVDPANDCQRENREVTCYSLWWTQLMTVREKTGRSHVTLCGGPS